MAQLHFAESLANPGGLFLFVFYGSVKFQQSLTLYVDMGVFQVWVTLHNVIGFMLRSLIHLNLSFVHRDKYGSVFILLHVDI